MNRDFILCINYFLQTYGSDRLSINIYLLLFITKYNQKSNTCSQTVNEFKSSL
jgi:hypothetical protein